MIGVVSRVLAGVRHVIWYLDFRTGGGHSVRDVS